MSTTHNNKNDVASKLALYKRNVGLLRSTLNLSDKVTRSTGNVDWANVRERVAQAAQIDNEQVSFDMLQQVWTRRAAQLAQAVTANEDSAQIELALVQLGRELYGLDVQYVFDIRPIERITRVPRTPDWVAGVVNWRGRILSVLDLQRFFGLPYASGEAGTPYLIVIETPAMEVALRADQVLSVQAMPLAQIQQTAGAVRGIRAEYVQGVAEHGRNGEATMLIVLDLPALLSDKQLVIHEEIA